MIVVPCPRGRGASAAKTAAGVRTPKIVPCTQAEPYCRRPTHLVPTVVYGPALHPLPRGEAHQRPGADAAGGENAGVAGFTPGDDRRVGVAEEVEAHAVPLHRRATGGDRQRGAGDDRVA